MITKKIYWVEVKGCWSVCYISDVEKNILGFEWINNITFDIFKHIWTVFYFSTLPSDITPTKSQFFFFENKRTSWPDIFHRKYLDVVNITCTQMCHSFCFLSKYALLFVINAYFPLIVSIVWNGGCYKSIHEYLNRLLSQLDTDIRLNLLCVVCDFLNNVSFFGRPDQFRWFTNAHNKIIWFPFE